MIGPATSPAREQSGFTSILSRVFARSGGQAKTWRAEGASSDVAVKSGPDAARPDALGSSTRSRKRSRPKTIEIECPRGSMSTLCDEGLVHSTRPYASSRRRIRPGARPRLSQLDRSRSYPSLAGPRRERRVIRGRREPRRSAPACRDSVESTRRRSARRTRLTSCRALYGPMSRRGAGTTFTAGARRGPDGLAPRIWFLPDVHRHRARSAVSRIARHRPEAGGRDRGTSRRAGSRGDAPTTARCAPDPNSALYGPFGRKTTIRRAVA